MKHSRFNTFQVANNLFSVFRITYCPDSIRQKSQPSLCGYNSLADAVEQQHIQLIFQLFDLL